jgi:hypothetical protein
MIAASPKRLPHPILFEYSSARFNSLKRTTLISVYTFLS